MRLEILEGAGRGRQIELNGKQKYIIGRGKECEVHIDDSKMSRHHAQLVVDAEGTRLEDMQSTNGTRLNGEFIQSTPIFENDEIIIGDTLFLVTELKKITPIRGSTTALTLQDGSKTVILSTLEPHEADLLQGQSKAELMNDLMLENTSLRKVSEICQLTVTGQDTGSIVEQTLTTMQELLQADTACVLMQTEAEGEWEICYLPDGGLQSESVEISRTIIRQAFDEGVAIMASDPLTDERFDPSLSIIAGGITSALCAPLKMGDHYLGVLFIDRRNKDEMFKDMDLRLTATVANLLGLLLEKEKLEQESRRKERLAVIGEVIAGLAHHTKNIITGLKFSVSALEVILKKGQMDSVDRCMRSINAQERRISDLVLNMLTYSKERVPVRSEFSLLEMLEDVIEPYRQHFHDKEIQFNLEAGENLPLIHAEEAALHRVFLNLVVNALDSFKLKPKDASKSIHLKIQLAENEKELLVTFEDTGCGIPQKKLDKIFTVFFSTKGSEGTGLGLAVVYKIIREHGGNISVASVENEWTRFNICLPVKAGA